tara:strand:- start:13450 stop:13857 length:408 start_codon:yes stop_codon:yes gene_type:complete
MLNSKFKFKMSKYKYKVRFHLGRGENYKKWQVRNIKDNSVAYYSPDEYHLSMHVCKLGNKPSVSTKIFNGENKTVCAWVWCDLVTAYKGENTRVGKQYRYNPRCNPHWHSSDEANLDNCEVLHLVTMGRGIFNGA